MDGWRHGQSGVSYGRNGDTEDADSETRGIIETSQEDAIVTLERAGRARMQRV